MAMLWNGGAGIGRRLCRYLSLFRMSTSVHGKRLCGLATDHRPDSASSTAQTTQGLAVAVSAAASYRADAAARKWPRRAEACWRSDQLARCTFWLEADHAKWRSFAL